MKYLSFLLFLAAFTAGAACADVLYLSDGTIRIGKLSSVSENGIVLLAFGKKVKIPPEMVIASQPTLAELKKKQIEVILKDNSVIRGKVNDYDEEIGLLLDLDFGTITVPPASLSSLEDPEQRSRFKGKPVNVGLSCGYYVPVGTSADSFDPGFSLGVFAEFNLKFLRGLYVGIEATQFFMNPSLAADVDYSVTALTLSPTYRLLFLRTTGIPFVRDLVPWVSLGGGVVYTSLKDNRDKAYQSSYGELSPAFCAGLGLDYVLFDSFIVRLSAKWLTVRQDSSPFHLPSFGIGGAYSF